VNGHGFTTKSSWSHQTENRRFTRRISRTHSRRRRNTVRAAAARCLHGPLNCSDNARTGADHIRGSAPWGRPASELPAVTLLGGLVCGHWAEGEEDGMRLAIATICAAALMLASCGGDEGSGASAADVGDSGGSKTADIDVCALLTDAEITAVLGEAPTPDPSEPAGPFTGCSWGTGDVIVSIATTDSIILAPDEDECPSAELGDESYACEGRVKLLANGIHVSVSTINPFVTDDQLLTLAATLLPKLQG